MQPHEQRVVTERDELQSKIVKLEGFMEGPIFDGMEYTDRKFMRIQLMAMMTYCEVLNSRIGRFT
tara:strand:+ start:11261 stop:11455 length:195 start_codon:yes stop_codon:yes gene_type:complete